MRRLTLTTQLTSEVKNDNELLNSTKDVLQVVEAKYSGSTTATIEDYMSELVDLLSIAERRKETRVTKYKKLMSMGIRMKQNSCATF